MQAKLKADTYETELKYLEQWRNHERWDDFNIILDKACIDFEQLTFACHYLLGTGAIDSSACYAEFQNVEREIESLAEHFRALPKAKQNRIERRTFKGVKTFACQDCNHVSFVADGNEMLYADELEQCFECGSRNITTGEM